MWQILRDLLRHNRGFAAGVCLLAFVLVIASLSFVSPHSPLDSFVVFMRSGAGSVRCEARWSIRLRSEVASRQPR